MTVDLTTAAARLACSIDWSSLTDSSRETVRRALTDYTACLAAGIETPQSRIVARRAAVDSGAGESAAAGVGAKVPAHSAALVNGTVSHAIDYDDVSSKMFHPSVVIAPATLAMAAAVGAGGSRIVSGYVAGFEVAARLCGALNPPHYNLGWHATATIGSLGAAAAAAHLLELDETGTAMALGIAASMAGGIRRNFGTMVKPLHAGLAAENGVRAARWASSGFEANPDVLSGSNGFLDVFAAVGTEVNADTFGISRLEIDESGIAFKRYSCCGAIHAALDVLLDQRQRFGIDPADVTSITCRVNSKALDILTHESATTPDEGRFSIQYSLAVAMIDGKAGPAQYTDERVVSPDVREMMSRARVVVDEDLPTGSAIFPATVAISLIDRELPPETVIRPRGYPDAPFETSVLEDKLVEGWEPYVGAADASTLYELVRSVEDWEHSAEYEDFITRLPQAVAQGGA